MSVNLAPSVAAVVDNRDIPDICLQHMVAVMRSGEAADRPRRVAWCGSPRRVERSVDLELADGTRLAERVSAVRGTLRNPMSRSEVNDKARDLFGPVLGQEKSKRLIETVCAIEAVKDVRALKPLLQPT